jgi:hypothetical protein
VPGINIDGDYWRDYAYDPRRVDQRRAGGVPPVAHLYMKMISPAGAAEADCHH